MYGYKGWSATAIKEGWIYGCWDDEPEVEYRECSYCGKVETDNDEWEEDKYGYICDKCKAEREREENEDDE